MNKSNMKNVIILKNLPSNLIDEAIMVVKDKKKVKDINYSDFIKYKEENGIIQGDMKLEDLRKIENIKKEDRKYVIKEAEVVVTNYIRRIEDNLSDRKIDKLKKSYKKSKLLNAFLAITTIISISLAILV
ncbi:MAG: hypothetical protein ACI4VC_05555 [Clostridia bacterium]